MVVGERWSKLSITHEHLVMWGAADQARVNYKILKHLGYRVEALIDDTIDQLSPFKEVPIYAGEVGLDYFLKTAQFKNMGFVIAIGNPFGNVRLKLHALLKSKGLSTVSFADPTAFICKTAAYGEGLQVMPAAIVHNDVRIGVQCIINTRALVEHDCVLSNGVEIGPGAVLCGRVHVGENTWIGANATVRPRVSIGKNTIIGAGAVAVNDIPDNAVAVGVPAKIIRDNRR